MSSTEELKAKGNAALAQNDYEKAIDYYTMAIEIDSGNHVLYSNRSAAYLKSGSYDEALSDAEKTVSLKPDWSKGYSRKGAALAYLGKHREAIATYEQGLDIDPSNESLKEGIAEVRKQMAANIGGGVGGAGGSKPDFRNLFGLQSLMNNPAELMKTLRSNPKTAKYFSDPSYLELLRELQENPMSMLQKMNDPRVMDTMSVMFGINMSTGGASAGGGRGGDDDDEIEAGDVPLPKKARESTNRSESARKETKPEPEPMDVEEVSDERKMALKQKESGNEAYKSKQFAKAIECYGKAIELDSTDITFYNNLGAVYFEMGNMEKCIELCEKAVEIGRENRADYKLIAKAFIRIANAYKRLKNYQNAKTYYEKAMSEHRTPETRSLLAQVEKIIKEAEKKAYLDPVRAEEENELGNACFKKGEYAAAVKHYTEATQRNPDEAKYFSNRAACYTKLAAFDLGLNDCDQCVKLDPKFIKGWLRKGSILLAMHQYPKAAVAFQKAMEIDPYNEEAIKGYRSASMECHDDDQIRERAMADPEIQAILRDPAMRLIMEQMQNDPNALREHMKNPEISAKIRKLMQCGIISVR